jgi:hypothetical protein
MPLIESEKFLTKNNYELSRDLCLGGIENRNQRYFKNRNKTFENLNVISNLAIMVLFVFTLQHCDMKKHCFNSSEADFTLILSFTLGLTYVIQKTLNSMKAKSLGQIKFEEEPV